MQSHRLSKNNNAGVTLLSPHELELGNQDALKQLTEQYKQVGSASEVKSSLLTASNHSTSTCMQGDPSQVEVCSGLGGGLSNPGVGLPNIFQGGRDNVSGLQDVVNVK